MKLLSFLPGCLFLTLCFSFPSFSEYKVNEDISLDAQFRYRTEFDSRDFNDDHELDEITMLRTQIGIRINPSDLLGIRIKLKDSRSVGAREPTDFSSEGVVVQEAYVSLKIKEGKPAVLELGRYEMRYGRNRVLGSGAWNNLGPKNYTGARLKFRDNNSSWDLFFARKEHDEIINYYDVDEVEGRQIIYGFAGSFYNDRIQPLVFIEESNSDNSSEFKNDWYLLNTAIYGQIQYAGIKMESDILFQMGERHDKDVNAVLVDFDLSWKLPLPTDVEFGAGIDYNTGASVDPLQSSTEKHTVTPWMSRHKFRGEMDLVEDVEEGLFSPSVMLKITPSTKTRFLFTWHQYNLVHSGEYTYYSSWNGEEKTLLYNEIGSEVNLKLTRTINENLSLDAAICQFEGNSYWLKKMYGHTNSVSSSYLFYLSLTAIL